MSPPRSSAEMPRRNNCAPGISFLVILADRAGMAASISRAVFQQQIRNQYYGGVHRAVNRLPLTRTPMRPGFEPYSSIPEDQRLHSNLSTASADGTAFDGIQTWTRHCLFDKRTGTLVDQAFISRPCRIRDEQNSSYDF